MFGVIVTIVNLSELAIYFVELNVYYIAPRKYLRYYQYKII